MSVTPAPFPSILKCSGQHFVDANGATTPRLKGFNIQAAGWPAQAFLDIHAFGGRILRTMVFWDQLEDVAGGIGVSTTSKNFISKLDAHISHSQAAGLYTILCLYYGPNGVHCPAWVGGSQLKNYKAHGQRVTEWLANRYGSNPSVMGMGINEPTPDSSSNSYLPLHLAEQQQMVKWFRPKAPHWIGFLACGYGGGAPQPNAPGSGHTDSFHKQTFTTLADPSGGLGNCAMELHVYKEMCTPASPIYDGRNAYGMPDNSHQIDVSVHTYPPSGFTRAQCQAFLKAYLASNAYYSKQTNTPFIIGEWGWMPGGVGGDLLATDLGAAIVASGAAAVLQWDYNTGGSDRFPARPGGTWGPPAKAMIATA